MQAKTWILRPLTSGVGLIERSDCEIVGIRIFSFKLSAKTNLTCFCYDLNDIQGELRVKINGIYQQRIIDTCYG